MERSVIGIASIWPVREFLSFEPVVRPSAQVHRCLNDDLISIYPIQKGIRKPVHEATSDACLNDRPPLRGFANVLNSSVDLVEKLTPEACRLKLVVLCCVKQL